MMRLPRGRVAVKSISDPSISSGGIIIPNEARERDDQGIIKYLGEDCDDLEVGEYVLFSGYTGTNIILEDEGSLIVMHKDFILAKIEEPNTPVPGLYYRDKKGWKDLEENIVHILSKFFDNPIDINNAADLITVAVGANHPYFNADYETAMELCADAMINHPFHRSTRIGWKRGTKQDFRHE